jgi:Na+/H+-dicarboxylate symporter
MKKIPLYLQILVALVLGILAGTFLPESTRYYSWIGTLFMNALCMLIVPIILFSVSLSVADIRAGGTGGLKRIGTKTVLWYVLTMLLAIVTGLLLVRLIQPGRGITVAPGEVPDLVTSTTVQDIISGFIPSNIFYAFAHNNTIPVIFLALVLGIAVPTLGEKSRGVLTDFMRAGYELTMKVTRVVISLAPIGIFAIVAGQFALIENVLLMLRNMLLYVVTVAAGLVIHTLITLPILLRVVGKVRPWAHLRNMSLPMVTAFSTASSGATIPLTLEAVEKKDGVSRRIADFVISLGATVNMNGAALLECVAVIFIAQVYGIELTLVQMITISFLSLICAIGSAGIPMSAMVMMAIILSAVGLPVEGIGLVIGVDRILDMCRTAVNVYGDTCIAVLVAKSEKEVLTIDLK